MYYGTDPVHDSARKSITTSKPDLTENKENIRFLKFEKEDFAKFLSEQENQRRVLFLGLQRNNVYHLVHSSTLNKPHALRLLQMKPKNIITHQIYQNLYFNICHKIAKNYNIHVDTFVNKN
jgi:hypothetical protein